jgi:uncharacterized cupredoxin-like copper-binding protein
VALWKLVHILSMFGAFGLTLMPMFLVGYLAARGDVAGVAGVLRARKRLNQVAGPLFLIGLVSGGAMIAIGGWAATSPWLVASYALVLAYGAWDAAVTRPWERAVERALALVDKSDEVIPLRLLRSRRPLFGAWGGVLGVVAIEAMMVLKPSFGLKEGEMLRRSVLALLLAAISLGGCRAADRPGPAAAAGAGRELVVVGTDAMRFDPPTIQARAGEAVTLTLKNAGRLPHDLVTRGASQDAVIANVPGGRQKSALFKADAPGTYQLVCPQPGHMEAGMTAQIVVTGGG